MKIVQINSTCGSGSTGKICIAVSKLLSANDIENYILYSIGQSDYPLGIQYMSSWETKVQALLSRIFGNYGFQSRSATKRLIGELERIDPDIVHLHNLHSHNVHLGMLFSYFEKKKIKLYWTFHDCWAFTGYCTYYDIPACVKWKSGCHKCPLRRHYSFLFDRSAYLYGEKKKLLAEKDITIVTPSAWLAEQIKQSFFHDNARPVVIHNGIDLSVFRPRPSEFRQKYNIENQFIILGVAFNWEFRKGLDVFIELSKRLDDRFQIVLVGANDSVEKSLPKNIIAIQRTENQHELAEIYTASDLLLNPTREDNYPTVNMEAIACGTPVLTFNTGGSPEIPDETCGAVVDCNDIDQLEQEILHIAQTHPFNRENCLKKAKEFDMHDRFKEYLDLYLEDSRYKYEKNTFLN